MYSLLSSIVNLLLSTSLNWGEKEINGQGEQRYEYLFIFGYIMLYSSKQLIASRLSG